jgi:hypothetical protein
VLLQYVDQAMQLDKSQEQQDILIKSVKRLFNIVLPRN